MILKYM